MNYGKIEITIGKEGKYSLTIMIKTKEPKHGERMRQSLYLLDNDCMITKLRTPSVVEMVSHT